MRWAGFAGRAGFNWKAGFAGRDDGGRVGAAVEPSVGAGAVVAGSPGTVTLQLTVWEQWV
ncbi:hypothetical protein [Pseudarthrobacter niigatensis]|uniref:Uncharacterized protein n=1 Tax=Pseudarthrobacter niigatensis TaxID=369935 RepID=A0AAJ1WG59_9MICC|nr:hypothetical protein [Pseudarthrobacter niigatensis]MDQ0145198.1 hypothetical protein [Pseudarthrobacter niigatensis]MDQ0266028.1 hypothetical protein [Pseudarthrobacter niigatensis]